MVVNPSVRGVALVRCEPLPICVAYKFLKDPLMREIQQSQVEKQHLTQRNTTLTVEIKVLEKIYQSLKDEGQRREIVNRLKRGDNCRSIMDWLRQVPVLDGFPPVTQQQFDETMRSSPQHWEVNPDRWNWTNMDLGDPVSQMGANIE
ncbi:MAG: hypothetical protein L6R38_003463 [Xanthoria sp. 2 TBL-2021]|nr:MAG: hypothetical protein L6R38_003463 [Xanthoria sp. 2 TBL-2021]